MALVEAIAAMRNALQPLLEDGTVPSQPPDMIGEYPMFVIYPGPGTWAPQSHGGKGGVALPLRSNHEVVIEWHMRLNDLAEAVLATTPMMDSIPAALWLAYADGNFSGTVSGMTNLRCETYGELGWGGDQTFGVRLIADISIVTNLS